MATVQMSRATQILFAEYLIQRKILPTCIQGQFISHFLSNAKITSARVHAGHRRDFIRYRQISFPIFFFIFDDFFHARFVWFSYSVVWCFAGGRPKSMQM